MNELRQWEEIRCLENEATRVTETADLLETIRLLVYIGRVFVCNKGQQKALETRRLRLLKKKK